MEAFVCVPTLLMSSSACSYLPSCGLRCFAPFSSDINNLSGAGHCWILWNYDLRSTVNLLGKKFLLTIDPSNSNLADHSFILGFHGNVIQKCAGGKSVRSHSFIRLSQNGYCYEAVATPDNVHDCGINKDHWTSDYYRICDPVITTSLAIGVFLFIDTRGLSVIPEGYIDFLNFDVVDC